MTEARSHLEKSWQIRCICKSHVKLELSLGITNANEGSELSFSNCFLIEGTSDDLLARSWLARGYGDLNPEYAACASAE